ncbi:DNA primase [Streptomyces badius]
MDPCDLRLVKGDDAVRDLVEPRTPLFEFALRQIVGRYDLETPAGRAAALDEAAAVVAKIKTSSVQREVAVQLAGLVGILDQEFVVHRVAQLARGRDKGGDQGDRGGRGGPQGRGPRGGAPQHSAPAPAFSGPALNLRSPAHRTERELLELALQARPGLPGLRRVRRGRVPPPRPTPPCAAASRRRAAPSRASPTTGRSGRGPGRRPRQHLRNLVTELAVEASTAAPSTRPTPASPVHVRLRAVDRRIADVQSSLARLGNHVAPQDLAAAQNEVWVSSRRPEFRAHGAAAL